MAKKIISSVSLLSSGVIMWTPPELKEGKSTYISFYAFCPVSNKLKRKKIMLNHITPLRTRRSYARELIRSLTLKLASGWNPWINQPEAVNTMLSSEVFDSYKQYLAKLTKSGSMREQTYASYLSYLKNFEEWVSPRARFLYQIDKKMVGRFLDHIFVERGNGMQTRNNYLAWLKSFCNYLMQRSYITENPTSGFTIIKKRNREKDRKIIPDATLGKIRQHLEASNPYFLLACYLLHYMFVRPTEMSFIKVEDFHLSGPTLTLRGEHTKNGRDAILTLPSRIVHLMLDLNIFSYAGSDYLFSKDFRPGRVRRSDKYFRDYWVFHVLKPLHLPTSYKFYSLKDTGITNMLKQGLDVLTVRDQARHSSILITDIYTPQDIAKVNKEILHYEGSF